MQIVATQQKYTNPMMILHTQLKDKTLKKSSLESINTISLSLGRKKTRQQLIPYLANIFVEETTQIQKLILKAFTQLLHPVYIGRPHHCRIILEIVMDVLCVYAAKEIRDEAYSCLEKVFAFIDVRKAQNILVEALKRLNNEKQDPNIRQLVIRMIPYVYAGVDQLNQSQLLQILNSFKSKPSDQKLLSQMLTQFIKVMPPAPESQIREIITTLIATKDKNILANLIEPVILLARISGEESTIGYFKEIVAGDDPMVVCGVLRKYGALADVFKEEDLTTIIEKIQNYDSQPQQIKNTILQVLQSLPIAEQTTIKLCQPPSSLQLKTTLCQTLCRVSDTKALLKLFNSSDPNFQVKLFPKLPPITQMHVQVIDRIMNSKSWRQKLAVLQNLEARMGRGEPAWVLVPKLFQFLGDKIACVRVGVADLITKIIINGNISIKKVVGLIDRSLCSKNWFQRQSAFKIIRDILKQTTFYLEKPQQKQEIKAIMRRASSQKVVNNITLMQQINKMLIKQ